MGEDATVLEQAQHFTFAQGSGGGGATVPTARAVGGRRRYDGAGAQCEDEIQYRPGRRPATPAATAAAPTSSAAASSGRRPPPAQALVTGVGASLRDYVPPVRQVIAMHAAPAAVPPHEQRRLQSPMMRGAGLPRAQVGQEMGLPLESPFSR